MQPNPTLLPKFKPFTYNNSIFVILTDPIEIPFFDDCIASKAAFTPLDITNPDEWKHTFTGYICWDLSQHKYEIIAQHRITNSASFFEETIDEGYIPFDTATSQLRNILGLLKFAYKCYGKENQMPTINIKE